jgi:hypothetical protein
MVMNGHFHVPADLPKENAPTLTTYRALDGLQSWCGLCGEKIIPVVSKNQTSIPWSSSPQPGHEKLTHPNCFTQKSDA